MEENVSRCTGDGCEVKDSCLRYKVYQECDYMLENTYTYIDPSVCRTGVRCYYKKM